MKPSLIIIINGHHPFVSVPEPERRTQVRGSQAGAGEDPSAGPCLPEERNFFEALSETYMPLLELFGRLEHNRMPFRLGMVLSPSLCAMLQDQKLLEKYLLWLDKRIAFGKKELQRCAGNRELLSLIRYYLDKDIERRISLPERYHMDILGALGVFQKKGCLEFLATAATHAFLPFYTSLGEAVRAQIETSLIHHRRCLGKPSSGFWLPELGWDPDLGSYLAEYHFSYTVVDAHALTLGSPPAECGSFYPVKTNTGLSVFARDMGAGNDFDGITRSCSGIYQFDFLDAGYDLSFKALKPLLDGEASAVSCRTVEPSVSQRTRFPTGYRYWTGGKGRYLYDPQKAHDLAAGQAVEFLDRRTAVLEDAQKYLDGALSLWVVDADALGRSWHEGTVFLETLIKEIAARGTVGLKTPAEYLDQANPASFQIMQPEFSSALKGGYGGPLLDASNDWIYRHIFRSIQRMVEMTERFPGDTGLKERALNQAAREILLAQSTDWSKPLSPLWKEGPVSREYAEKELEGTLRNFTTIYEALGSNHISTEWLTAVEKKHAIFPHINYRVFGRKK